MQLRSARVEADTPDDAFELMYERGWTDGLPVIPPTEDRVRRVLDYLKRDPQEVIGAIPPRNGLATVEKIAINSVMAGCRPEYVPVVIAAVQCILEEEFNLHGVQSTTHCVAPLTIVGGPIVKELGFNAGDGCFGGGSRANATVGRAVRLILWNIGGGYPGDVDRATHGHPGKYTYCIAENQPQSPWEPLHVARGVQAENAVTVFGCEAPHSVWSTPGDARTVLYCIADAMRSVGNNNATSGGQCLVVVNPRAASVLKSEGFTRRDVQRYLHEYARRPLRDIRRGPKASEGATDPTRGRKGEHPDRAERLWPRWLDVNNEDALLPIFHVPEDIHVVVAGGWGPSSASAWCAPAGGTWAARPRPGPWFSPLEQREESILVPHRGDSPQAAPGAALLLGPGAPAPVGTLNQVRGGGTPWPS